MSTIVAAAMSSGLFLERGLPVLDNRDWRPRRIVRNDGEEEPPVGGDRIRRMRRHPPDPGVRAQSQSTLEQAHWCTDRESVGARRERMRSPPSGGQRRSRAPGWAAMTADASGAGWRERRAGELRGR